jgi:hypothetical protein
MYFCDKITIFLRVALKQNKELELGTDDFSL